MAIERLHLIEDGRVRLSLRQPWRDGTTELVFTPLELLERLAVLVPRPRINLVLYFGVLGARAAGRAEMTGPGGVAADRERTPEPEPNAPEASAALPECAGGRNRAWATLMQRTFGFEVLACPHCGGRLRLIALIEQRAVIGRVLGHLGLPTELPVPRPARPPPEHPRLEEPAFACEFDVFMPVS